jgi:putative ABC transport system permease protein
MRLIDLFSSALSSLSINKLRSGLTTLGIVIGVGAVVFMMALTSGFDSEVTGLFSGLGSNTFQIQKWPHMKGGRHHSSKWRKRKDISVGNADAIRDRSTQARFVGAELWHWGLVIRSRYHTTPPRVVAAGGTPEFAQNNGYDLAEGRTLNGFDVLHQRNVTVLGADLARDLFPHGSPVGQYVNFRSRRFLVTGVFASKGSFFGMGSRDNYVLVPITTFVAIWGKNRSVNITVQAMDPKGFDQARDDAIQIMRQERGVKPDEGNDFEVFSNESSMDQVNSVTGSISVAALAIAFISLLVGGIGIMNIMMVSVTERTREIGVRRALGARKRHILWQFTVEAVFLSALGGILGLGVGFGGGYLVRTLTGMPAAAPVWAVIVALGMSSVTGLVFGIYPAWKASQQDPIEALHYE